METETNNKTANTICPTCQQVVQGGITHTHKCRGPKPLTGMDGIIAPDKLDEHTD